MGKEALLALVNNAALLITFVVLYTVFYVKSTTSRQIPRQIISGFLLGMVTVGVMLNSWQLSPGVVFDTRSVALGLIGLFFGFIPSMISASMAVGLRILMGGEGTIPGISTILSSVSVGLIWQHHKRRDSCDRSLLELYLFGIVVHVFMLLCMLLLPSQSRETFFEIAALPVMIVYPAATMIVGWAMTGQIARKRGEAAESELASTSERLAVIVKNSPVAIISLDLDYKVTSWNEAAEEIFGWKCSEVLGKPLPYILETQKEDYERMNVETLKGLPVRGERFAQRTKDGREIIIKVYNAPIRDENGNLEGIFGILEDVTEQHKAELALKESELRFRKLYMNMNIGVAIYRVINEGDDVVFLDMNPSGCRITGVNREEILGRSVKAIFPSVVELGLYQRLIEVWKTSRPMHHPVRRYKDEKIDFWADNYIYPDRSHEVVAIFEDVTQRELMLEELERRVKNRTEELEAANKELESFAYSVSHDLRAPLRAINGFSKIISDRYMSSLPEEGQRYLGFISKAGGDMSDLIDGLLEYSRIGRSSIHLNELPLKSIVDDCIATLNRRIEEEGAEVSIITDLPTVYANQSLLKRAVTNLLQNALTYHNVGSRPIVKISSKHHKGWVFLTIEDNGIGIEDRYHERIFNVFQRLHTDEEFPGTGIGLSIVKKSVLLMGGDVSLESIPGEGSKFTLKIKGV